MAVLHPVHCKQRSAWLQVIPHSVTFIGGADEGGGGNRISEEQIKNYLDSILGEAPRPDWGVPQGWGAYISGAQSAGREGVKRVRLSRGQHFGTKVAAPHRARLFVVGYLRLHALRQQWHHPVGPALSWGAHVGDLTSWRGDQLPKPCWTAS